MIGGATEYRDPWRGLRILVPPGWRVRRAGAGLFLHAESPAQAIVVQPRPGVMTGEALAGDLLAWLKRLGPEAGLQCRAHAGQQMADGWVRLATGQVSAGVFALQTGESGGLISGFLAPAERYEDTSRIATASLASLASISLQPRQPWLERSQRACSALLPQGWQARARLRRSRIAALPRLHFEAWADEATRVTATTDGRLYLEPGLLSGILAPLAGGLAQRGRFLNAAGYAERHLLPALQRETTGARIDAVVLRPDLIPALVAQEAATAGVGVKELLQAEPSVADVVTSISWHGRRLRQVSRVLTLRVPPPLAHRLSLWLAVTRHSYRAPMEELGVCEPVLEGVALSFRESPRWRAREECATARIGSRSPEPPVEMDEAALLVEAESLMGSWGGRPLAVHERPFTLPEPQPVEGALAGLFDRTPWR